MPVFTATYVSPAGDTMFYDPKLALGVIYSFSIAGQPDFTEAPYDEAADPPPGSFMYNRSNGQIKVNPDTPFPVGNITIIYKAEGIPVPPPPEPPAVCEPLTSDQVFSAIVAGNRVFVAFFAPGNYQVDIIPAAGTCGDAAAVSNTVYGGANYTSTPLPAGSYKACVRKICAPGLFSARVASNTVTITLPPPNFGARKGPADPAIKIISLTGVPYTLRSGSLPLVTEEQEMRGRHEGFSGVRIRVNITVKKKQQVVVSLYKNGPLVQYIAVYQNTAGSAFVLFDPISATPSDDVFVLLGYY